MKNVLKWLLLMLCISLVTLAACTPTVRPTKSEDVVDLVEGLEYAKAKNGLCFGVVTVSRISSNGTTAINQMITNVPCKEVGL
jgi:hypothetical protein